MKKLSFERVMRPAMLLAAASLSVIVGGCVDNDYDLDNISKEVTIGGDEVVIPLGHLDKQLSDLLDGEIDGLVSDEYGNYVYNFDSGENNSLSIDKIDIPAIDVKADREGVTIDYPAIAEPKIDPINPAPVQIANGLSGVSVVAGTDTISTDGKANCSYTVDAMPSMIKKIETLYLGNAGETEVKNGAELNAVLSLEDLTDISEGGEMTLTLSFPQGYTLKNAAGKTLDSTTYSETKSFAAGQSQVEFSVNIYSIDLSNLDVSKDNVCDYTIDYDVKLELKHKAGTVGSTLPQFTITSNPIYVDAQILTADLPTAISEKSAEGGSNEMSNVFTGLENVESVNTVHFNGDKAVGLRFGTHNFPEAVAGDIMAEIALPDFYVFRSPADNSYTIKDGTVTASIATLSKGIDLWLEYIDCTRSVSGGKVENGQMHLDGSVVSTIYVPAGKSYRLSQVKPADTNKPVQIDIEVEADGLEIASVEGVFKFSKTIINTIEMDDLADFGLDISSLGIEPVIAFYVDDNPTGVALVADIELIPENKNGEVYNGRTVSVHGVNINGSGATDIVISTPDRAEFYPDRDFVAVEGLADLLAGEVPANIKLEAVISASPEPCTINVSKTAQTIEYGYAVTIPLEFNPRSNASYSVEIEEIAEGIGESLEGIKIHEAVVVGKFKSTIPLTLSIEATPLDKDENDISDRVSVGLQKGYDSIVGSADGKTPAESEVHIVLDIASGEFNDLKLLDKLALTLSIANNSDRVVALNNSQSLSAVLTLQINGGITVDIDKVGSESGDAE